MVCVQDLTLSLDDYKDKLTNMSSDRDRLAAVVSAKDLTALDQRLHLLDCLWTEVHEQVSVRRSQVQERLECWSDFDDQCRRLMEDIAECESVIEGNSGVSIEQRIDLLQTVSWLCRIGSK